jgi:DNA-binding response OmpR family regulator
MTGTYALVITGKNKLAYLCQEALEREGFNVQVETTGARAQVQLAFTNPDLVVLDLNLPDLPGEVILRQLSAHHRLSHTRLILLLEEAIPAPTAPKYTPDSILAQPFAAPELASLAAEICTGSD